MGGRVFRWFRVALTLIVMVALASGAAVVLAGIPDADGVINACFERKGGALRVVDSPTSCNSKTELALHWNQAGPAGPPGADADVAGLTVTLAGDGAGSVVSGNGIQCGADCVEVYPRETAVTLQAVPEAGSRFSGWSGDCAGTAVICVVSMTSAQTVQAEFRSTRTTVYFEDFAATAPDLPADWHAVLSRECAPPSDVAWGWSNRGRYLAASLDADWCSGLDERTTAGLVSPSISLPAGTNELEFINEYSFDVNLVPSMGGWLEIEVGSGSFVDILEAGGVFLEGGYTGVVHEFTQNAHPGWIGSSPVCGVGTVDPARTRIRLPEAQSNLVVRLRWVFARQSSFVAGCAGYEHAWSIGEVAIENGS